MINISAPSPATWTTPVSTAVAPVSATAVVKKVQSGGREAQADVEARRESRQPTANPEEQNNISATSLPKSSVSDPQLQASAQLSEEAVALRAEQLLKKAEADKAGHKKAMERLQEVLSNMWAASAAVVEQALGIEPKNDALPGARSDTAPDLSAVAASTISRRQSPRLANAPHVPHGGERAATQGALRASTPTADEGGTPADATAVPGGEVVAYDENGNSSMAPMEAGSIISERV